MQVPLPRRGAHSPFIYLRPSRAIHKCVPHRAGHGSVGLRGSRVVELVGKAARPVEPKAVSAKVRAVHHVFLARWGLNVVQVDS
jgi:hypothetical protein